ncbi:TIGR01621 family pseudouridine synthase [Shewanella violacea]|uniref:Ribosomal pseudouridine synthase Rlu family protein n=1 Tax=Shewanella violacea (strain JCM 10179 / CIP 106290 / LMG 19151 / DSS12) TaxID=637905 RepID=D4ZF44_SHEVD|nr:TIGR01621 family pseudouridine synthase [Shewanella violacea]BAJ04208.1 ribosomal pseudouridine synthase Rlu family protein [Shewanella violacea DSS12]
MYQIIADEDDFLVIAKSPNVHFHSQDGSAGVMASLEQDLAIKLYSVHRLDSLTSGLLLFAKSSRAAAEFTELFTQHKIQKYYVALATGKPKKKQGWVVGDMAKSRRSMYKLLRTTENPALTQFFSQSVAEGLRLYLLKPLSGKTHQLRVALASLGVPILGDHLYGGAESDRGYLHAFSLSFSFRGKDYRYLSYPSQGEQFTAVDTKKQLQIWSEPEKLAWPKRK